MSRLVPLACVARLAVVTALCAACVQQSTREAKLGPLGREPEPLPTGAEARSLSGQALYPPPLSPEQQAEREKALEDARAAHAAAPHDADALVMLARRLGAVGRFREEIEVLTVGVEEHELDPRMLRHRGHRWITLRRFDKAVEDLDRAAWLVRGRPDEVEAPLQPNERGVAIDTLNQNVFYHLGLAHYLQGDFDEALGAYHACREYSKNPDALCSATDWLYLTLRRLHRDAEAKHVLEPVTKDLDVIEYHAYHRLVLAYRGEIDPDQLLAETLPTGKTAVDYATIGYGVGTWHLCEGHRERALEIYRKVAENEAWHAFGRIASEVELQRLR